MILLTKYQSSKDIKAPGVKHKELVDLDAMLEKQPFKEEEYETMPLKVRRKNGATQIQWEIHRDRY